MTYVYDKSAKVEKWEVSISTEKQYGCFEHDDYGEGGGLWFINNELEDFDGMCELPESVAKAIELCGFKIDKKHFYE